MRIDSLGFLFPISLFYQRRPAESVSKKNVYSSGGLEYNIVKTVL